MRRRHGRSSLVGARPGRRPVAARVRQAVTAAAPGRPRRRGATHRRPAGATPRRSRPRRGTARQCTPRPGAGPSGQGHGDVPTRGGSLGGTAHGNCDMSSAAGPSNETKSSVSPAAASNIGPSRALFVIGTCDVYGIQPHRLLRASCTRKPTGFGTTHCLLLALLSWGHAMVVVSQNRGVVAPTLSSSSRSVSRQELWPVVGIGHSFRGTLCRHKRELRARKTPHLDLNGHYCSVSGTTSIPAASSLFAPFA